MGTRSTHVALCLLRVAREHLLAAAAPYPLFGSTLFVCLFVCLFGRDWPLQNTPSMARRTLHARRLFAVCCAVCAAARGARRRDARARAACTSRRRCRRLHGAGRGTCHAAVAAARDDRRGGGCAGLHSILRISGAARDDRRGGGCAGLHSILGISRMRSGQGARHKPPGPPSHCQWHK
jgi:hypothetical protein